MSESSSNVFTYYVDFEETIPLYRGVKRIWIGDGTEIDPSAGTGGTAGDLYAAYATGEWQELGYVSDFEEAKTYIQDLDYSQWVQILSQCPANAIAAASSKEDSEAYAIGKRNGVDVVSSDPAYHNNSKYYSEQAASSSSSAAQSESNASGSAGSASASATNAATSKRDAEAYAIGKRDNVDVVEGDPAYHNNALYYNTQAAVSKSDSEAYAVGTRNGTAVVSGDPAYHNNAKYYNDSMASAAVYSINGKTGDAVLTGDDIAISSTDNTPISTVITTAQIEALFNVGQS